MSECFRCQRDSSQVKLLDGIYTNELVKICEECALTEDIPIVRRPTSSQIQESVRPFTVRERLSRMTGTGKKERAVKDIKAQAGVCDVRGGITLDNLRPAKDYNKVIENRFEAAKKANMPVDMVDNFNWMIQNARRSRKITLPQLGNIIGESELALKMIEQGNLVDDASRIIVKLEQFFKIKLRKGEAAKEEARMQETMKDRVMPARILNFNPDTMKNITISDLKKMKQEKERAQSEASDKEAEEASRLAWRGGKGKETGKDVSYSEINEDEGLIGSDIELLDD
jgi:hypothetical protein